MLAGLSADVRQLLYKQVSDAKRNQSEMISTQPSDDTSASAGPGPSTIGQKSRAVEDGEGQ